MLTLKFTSEQYNNRSLKLKIEMNNNEMTPNRPEP